MSYSFRHIKLKDSRFYYQMENDVEQINDARKVGGIGLENMQKRLQLLYPGKHELQIEDVDHKFKVTLKIALKN